MARFIELNRPLVHVRNYSCVRKLLAVLPRRERRPAFVARDARLCPRLIIFSKYVINIRLSNIILYYNKLSVIDYI